MKETTFLGFEFKIGQAKSVKNESHVFFVFLHILTKHQNVDQEDEDKREEIFIEDACHKSLEGFRCIAKSKWKSEVLVVSSIGSDEAVFGVALSANGTFQYPEARSRLEKIVAP